MEKKFCLATISLVGLFVLMFFRVNLKLEVFELLVLIISIYTLIIFPFKHYLKAFHDPLSREGFVGFGLAIGAIYSIVNLIMIGAVNNIIQISLIALIYYLYNRFIADKSSDLVYDEIRTHNLSDLEKNCITSLDIIRWVLILYFLISAFIINNIYRGEYNLIISLLLLILFSSNLKIFRYAMSLPFLRCKNNLEKLDTTYANNLLIEKVFQSKDIFIDVRGVAIEDRYEFENIHASNPKYALQIAASLMRSDDHPLSKAVLFEAESKDVTKHFISHTNNFQGKGIIGRINNENFAIGNMELMKEVDIAVGVLIREKIKLENQGKTVLVLAKTLANKKSYDKNPGEVIGLFIFNSEVIPQFDQISQNLSNENINLTYLSGEEGSTLMARLENVKHEELLANLSSEEKIKYIEQTVQKNIDKYYIQISKKLVVDNSNLVNILIDNHKISGLNIISINQYDPKKLLNIYRSMTDSYKKARTNYHFSWLYHIFIMFFSISAVKLSSSGYIYIVAFLLSLLSEQLVIINSNSKQY